MSASNKSGPGFHPVCLHVVTDGKLGHMVQQQSPKAQRQQLNYSNSVHGCRDMEASHTCSTWHHSPLQPIRFGCWWQISRNSLKEDTMITRPGHPYVNLIAWYVQGWVHQFKPDVWGPLETEPKPSTDDMNYISLLIMVCKSHIQ